jgi:hypothetical protein
MAMLTIQYMTTPPLWLTLKPRRLLAIFLCGGSSVISVRKIVAAGVKGDADGDEPLVSIRSAASQVSLHILIFYEEN